MTSFLVLLIIATLFVTARLLFLRLHMNKFEVVEPAPEVIEGKVAGSGPLELRGFQFDGFEAEAGPADRNEFFAQLRVTVGRPGAGRESRYRLFVTTPSGLAAYLKKNRSGSEVQHQFGRDLLVVERYDSEAIRAAVLARLDDLAHISEQTS